MTTPIVYHDNFSTTLVSSIGASDTTGISLYTPKDNNGDNRTITTGVAHLRFYKGNKQEIVKATLTQSGATIALSSVVRDMNPDDDSDETTRGQGLRWSAGTKVDAVVTSKHMEGFAKKDVANTFTEDQTISGTKKLYINDANTYVYDDGTDLIFKDSNNSETTLATLAATGGADEKVGISVNDTTPDYLVNKVTGGDGITVTETNDGGDETLDIDVDLATDKGLEISGGQLQIKAHTGITLDSNGISVDTSSITGDMEHIGSITAASSVVGASSTAEANMAATWSGSDTIDANSLAAGDIIHLKLSGGVQLTAGTLTIRVYMGSTAIYNATLTVATPAAVYGWSFDTPVSVRSIGASGSLFPSGSFVNGTTGFTNNQHIKDNSTGYMPGASTIDTTANQQILVKAQFSSSNSAHKCSLQAGSITLQHA